MRIKLGLCCLLLALCAVAASRYSTMPSVSTSQWTLTTDAGQGAITVNNKTLGVLLQNVHLFVNAANGRQELKEWHAQEKDGQLQIRTSEPPTGWSFDLGENTLTISSTEYDAELIADAPAPPTRIIARLMDDSGVPVDWVGTREVAGTYGGSLTHNRSFLPRVNPDVMYFTLGQTEGSLFHNLFDRETDTAIDFGEAVAMSRNPQNPDLLKITLPVHGSRTIRLIPGYYTKTLGVPFYSDFDDTNFRAAPMVWSSWT